MPTYYFTWVGKVPGFQDSRLLQFALAALRGVFFCMLALAGLIFFAVPWAQAASQAPAKKNTQAAQKEKEAYLRAVYILRALDENARQETITIPRRVIVADETESLLRHPDSVFVLKKVRADFSLLKNKQPEALLYESYACFALGLEHEGAELLTSYVAIAPYNAHHYTVLSRALKDLRDYTSLYIIAREWAERDAACQKERIVAEWHGLFGLGRYSDAAKVASGHHDCLGWAAGIYEAAAEQAMGNHGGAAALVNKTIAAHPQREIEITRLWTDLSKNIYGSEITSNF